MEAICMMQMKMRGISGWCLSTLVLACLLLIPSGLLAQVGSAALSGVVQDTTGAVVPGATATLTSQVSGAQRSATSNGDGIVTFSAIPSGDYNLNVTANGFKGYTQAGIHLDPGDNKSIPEIKLAVGPAVETVTVEQSVGSLPLDSGQLSSTITSSDLDRLSVVGRDATELQRTLPGFAIRNLGSTNQAPDFSQVQIGQPTPYASNGAPVAGITLKLDGANLTDAGSFGASLQNLDDSTSRMGLW
jgi:hypothetical protein